MEGMKKWYKVVLDKTGAILSCDEVDAAERDNKFVRFIEAVDKADACSDAKQWYERKMASHHASQRRSIERRMQQGLCVSCSRPKTEDRVHKQICRECNDRAAKRRREIRAGAEPLLRRGVPPEEQLSHARSRNREYQKERTRKKRAEEFEKIRAMGFEPPQQPPMIRMLKVLEKFDALDPREFRAWLVSEIEGSGVIPINEAEPIAAE